MKANKIILIVGSVIIVCLGSIFYYRTTNRVSKSENDNIEQLSSKQLLSNEKNKKDFVLYVYKDSCEICKEFYPRYKKIIKTDKYKRLKYVKINSSQNDEFLKDSLGDKYQGTPSVYFYKEGRMIDYFIGSQDDSVVDKYLTKYISMEKAK
ncbi:thioredoxin family protein [Enterococcus faecalis]|uniref:thioredoxin family protein n=1 Tax=Enterococcus faecalis TaxID=1351 RepID=UPI0001F0B086|nr:thioredoxin family protein [Enterococcus faecalis]EFU18513.1 hypothetical protein HMPREF9519_00424 [Enterococcus faecalis TX1346]EJX8006667.1 thioredoxin family protein [Enterococcus faecalis]MDE3930026.1 thioredoxin family protein [Enterococcus faecalis]HAP5185791.1 thioredoxin family protein [Enterococcus faecalis]HCY9007877.1 thioredoxin family protein [Enterococcus faecalis]